MKNKDDDNFFVKLAKSGPKKKSAKKKKKSKDDDSDGQLTVDVYKDGDFIVVESTVAGVDPDDLDINITSESVTIKGERERNNEVDDENFYYQECFWGSFSRSIILPEEVDPDESEANFDKNGVLEIRMPVLKKSKAKKLEVNTD